MTSINASSSSSFSSSSLPLLPADFLWGAATASYQSEGAVKIDGRSPSIWDIFSHTPGKIHNNDTGDIADDDYHRYINDINLLEELGVGVYRFSIAPSRILPDGINPNPLAISHYNSVINYLLSKNIQPFITLYHWDLPACINNQGGFLNQSITINFFLLYADTVFNAFGDRVKYWLTFNEPKSFTVLGYESGIHAPGRCTGCSEGGDSATEPYIAAHNVLLAHGHIVSLYRSKYASIQKGKIGITLNTDWAEPLTSSPADIEASERAMQFSIGWYADPIYFGDYPVSMKTLVKDRLPVFTDEEKQLLKGSVDFFGLNHYTSAYNFENLNITKQGPSYDSLVSQTFYSTTNNRIGPSAASSWLAVVPWGLRKTLQWINNRYGGPNIYITENGVDVPNENNLPLKEALQDSFRINYYSGYIQSMMDAILIDNIAVKGYIAWSLLDNFEWADGYALRFGLVHIDYNNNLTRYPKNSYYWYKQLLTQQKNQNNNIVIENNNNNNIKINNNNNNNKDERKD